MDSQDNELFLAASRRYEQQGGNPIFRAIFTQAGRNRSFRGIVHQKKFRLTFLQLRTPEENELNKSDSPRTAASRPGRKHQSCPIFPACCHPFQFHHQHMGPVRQKPTFE